jgi:hypothetical protein
MDHLRALRQDMRFERQGKRGKVMQILEFVPPYGYESHGINTLERFYGQKGTTDVELAKELGRLRNHQVNVAAAVVSSIGQSAYLD